MQSERLDGAVGEMAAVRMEGREAADVDIEDIEGRFAVDDPFSDQPACATGVRNAGRIETCTNEIAAELGRFAQDEIAVQRKAFRTVQEQLDLGRLEARRAMNGVLHQHFELVPIFRQQLKFEALGNPLDVPRFCDGLEAAHYQSADFLLVVNESVWVADYRQLCRHAADRLRHHVKVLSRVKRHVDPCGSAEFTRPLAGTVDDDLACDFAAAFIARPGDAFDVPVVASYSAHFHAFDDPGAAHA